MLPLLVLSMVPPLIMNVFATFPNADALLMFTVPAESVKLFPALPPNVLAPHRVSVPAPVLFILWLAPEITPPPLEAPIVSVAPEAISKLVCVASDANTRPRLFVPFPLSRVRLALAARKIRSPDAEPATVSPPPERVMVVPPFKLPVMVRLWVAAKSFNVPMLSAALNDLDATQALTITGNLNGG